MKRKHKKSKDFNINQASFYFEDYLEINQKNKNKNKIKIKILIFPKTEFIFSSFCFFH